MRSILCVNDLDTNTFCYDTGTSKLVARGLIYDANEGIGLYSGVIKLGNDAANKSADPFLEDRFINTDAYSLNISADDGTGFTGAFQFSPIGVGFYNADSNTSETSGVSTSSLYTQLYANDNTNTNTLTIDPVSLTVSAYPETRDDTGITTPVNFLYTDITGKVLSAPLSSLSSATADEGIGTYSGVFKLGNDAANQLADPLLEDRYINTDQYHLQIGGAGTSNYSSIDVGGTGIATIAADNTPGAGTDSSNITVQPTSVSASTSDGTNTNTLTLLPTDVTVSAYPNTRDDSAGITPINFLYTDPGGTVLSAPLTDITTAVNDTNSVDLTLTGSTLTADVKLKPTDSSLQITPTGLTVVAPTKTATDECGAATTNATVKHSLAEVVKDSAGKLWSTIPTAHTKISSNTGAFTYSGSGAIAVTNAGFSTIPAVGVAINSPINTTTFTNPDTCRSMNITIFLEWNRAVTVAQLNSFMGVRHQVYVDLGGGTLVLVAQDDTRRSSTGISTVSESTYGSRMANVVVAPGASVTLRLQTVTTLLATNMALGSISDSNVFAQLKVVDGGTV